MSDVLPDSRAREARGVVTFGSVAWVPIYCANCGADGGLVPEEGCTFAFYLCQGCADKHGPIAGTMIEPDVAFWQRMEAAQLERHGRILSPDELRQALDEPHNPLALLARESPLKR